MTSLAPAYFFLVETRPNQIYCLNNRQTIFTVRPDLQGTILSYLTLLFCVVGFGILPRNATTPGIFPRTFLHQHRRIGIVSGEACSTPYILLAHKTPGDEAQCIFASLALGFCHGTQLPRESFRMGGIQRGGSFPAIGFQVFR